MGYLDQVLGPLRTVGTEDWLRKRIGEFGGSTGGATGSWDKELIPPMEEATTMVPASDYDPSGYQDPSTLALIQGLLKIPALGTPAAMGEFIGQQAVREANAPAEPSFNPFYALAGLGEAPPAPTGRRPVAAPPAMTAQPVSTPAPTPAPAQPSGYVHLTDKAGNVIKDYTGTGSSYKPSEMVPGSSAYEFFERPRQTELLKQQLEQARVGQVQAETARDQFLLEQARKLGPQVLFGQTGDAETRRLQSMMDFVESRAKVKQPEAMRMAKEAYEKANPGKKFEGLSEQDRMDSVNALAKKLAQDELEQTQRMTMGFGGLGLSGLTGPTR